MLQPIAITGSAELDVAPSKVITLNMHSSSWTYFWVQEGGGWPDLHVELTVATNGGGHFTSAGLLKL